MPLRIDILTLFPEMFEGFVGESMIRIAQEKGLVDICLTDIRDFSRDRHQKVDDTPYGGGPGMVMKVQPVVDCIEAVVERDRRRGPIVLMTPQGEVFHQRQAHAFAERADRLILVCGHYEGFDERIRAFCDMELSIGDYVLSGGEVPAMVVTDAVVRLVPGVLGDETSPHDESFSDGYLEYPQYTRPPEFRGMAVPDILLSGHHAEIEKWRREQARVRTRQRRPDL
ncbi:MAG TPA: tRNA (guanosine(37)-N1)-methyltransferase TrmD [Phycisphaerae bacterium]|nr:tRNA (guanosine(37)-N1)-methyltransferase TrmD [Phycisphaerae bacterium]HOI54014.1 tRNA (guanosine(37)-N1)-methyltransferase TrmD [Phycisphaerae bacterium]